MNTKNYKDTLLLPQTSFSMKADLPLKEPVYVQRWKDQNLYQNIQNHRQGSPLFVLHDGPPYANGRIHHGHIFNKTLKDIVVKYYTMSGFQAPYVPGWDCHGLPIEQKIDEELGANKKNFSHLEIRQKCREYAQKYVQLQSEDFERIGVLGQFNDPYITMSYEYEARTLEILGQCFEKNIVYKGFKPVHWSWAAQTALADAEVEYAEYVAHSVYVSFALSKLPSFLQDHVTGLPLSVLIWTTTPWTLPANLAIALNPEFEYVVACTQEHCYVMARALVEQVSAATGKEFKIVTSFWGHELVGHDASDCPRHEAKHPFIDRSSVLLPGAHVTLEQGTGCVHTAPGHGEEDFYLGLQFQLPVLVPVDARGYYDHQYPEMQGKHVLESNLRIIEILQEKQALLSPPSLKIKIARYPYCWRTKKPVIFRATEQWFIGIDKDSLSNNTTIRQRSLDEIHQNVQWIPSWGQQRIFNMMEHRPDWCISRQRLWGVPITIFVCQHCNQDIIDPTIAYHVASLAQEKGSDVWFDLENKDLVPLDYCCPHCGGSPDQFTKAKDILDVWFDSGVSWYAAMLPKLNLPQHFQSDLYLEGSDQHRGWFNSSLISSVATREFAPYKACLTHGFILDEHGNKYSKSSKNYESPEKMLSKDGADILRLWTTAVDYRGDITLSPQIMETVKDAYRKIRNTFRFLLANINGFVLEDHKVDYSSLEMIDQWILSKLYSLIHQVDASYKNYEFHIIYHSVIKFMTVDLSNHYLHIIKDRMYADHSSYETRRSAQTSLYYIVHALARMLAPILSFTMEEVWDHLKHPTLSVHINKFIHLDVDFSEEVRGWKQTQIEEEVELLLQYKDEVYKKINDARPKQKGEKVEGQIGSSEEAEVYLVLTHPEDHKILQKYKNLLPALWVTSTVHIHFGEIPQVQVSPSRLAKCFRCWRYCEDTIVDENDSLCARCTSVLALQEEASAS